MEHEPDGVHEAIEGQLRVGLGSAATLGQTAARLRQQLAQDAQGRSEQHTRDLTARLEAQRQLARAQLAGVNESAWWDKANAPTIADAYETATAWRADDPYAAGAAEKIADEVRDRYDLDIRSTALNARDVLLATEEAAHARAEATRLRAENERDSATAQLLLAESVAFDQLAADQREQADDQDRRAELDGDPAFHAEADRLRESAAVDDVQARERAADADRAYELADVRRTRDEAVIAAHEDAAEQADAIAAPAWDSAERRETFRKSMKTAGVDKDAVEARMLADVSAGAHPRDGLQPKARRSVKVSKGTTKTVAHDRELSR